MLPRLSLYLLCLFLLIASCGGEDTDPAAASYLALGDSYTIGESVAASDRFPVQLARELRAAGIAINEPRIIARTGWTTGDLLAAMDGENFREAPYDLVTLLIGVNNQFRGGSLAQYRSGFEELLQRAIDLAGGDASRVLVLSIPDYAFTPFGQSRPDPDRISDEIDLFNAAKQEISSDYGVRYFDITPLSRQGLDRPELVAADGLHPSAVMYAGWVDQLLPEAIRVLE